MDELDAIRKSIERLHQRQLFLAWRRIRERVERAANQHWDDTEHPLSPWSFVDATELEDALDYIEDVLKNDLE